ncbi:MAG: hypothetical protein CMJ64_23455 [Planctomycetaceae bacterium]|nr:hypothetical protein [Planctomycetaceae bacterium]
MGFSLVWIAYSIDACGARSLAIFRHSFSNQPALNTHFGRDFVSAMTSNPNCQRTFRSFQYFDCTWLGRKTLHPLDLPTG